jgi:D-arabinose 1-dehydrogenase-like Zn-dependent alcohol dehydrogenase
MGDVPAVTDGRILGHEAVGTGHAVRAGVKTVAPGDRVLVSCMVPSSVTSRARSPLVSQR